MSEQDHDGVEQGISAPATVGPCRSCGRSAPLDGVCPACGTSQAGGVEAAPLGVDEPGLFPGYVVLCRVGAGGMGEVFQAHPRGYPNQPRAIKLLKPELAANPGLQERFERERIAMQAIVQVPGVVPVIDGGRAADGRLFLVMHWVDGRSLAAALKDPSSPLGRPSHPVLPAAAADLVVQLGRALDGAHALGVVHRDVKPSNIMLRCEPEGGAGLEAVLIDFGIASLGPSARSGTGSAALGTIEHLAPEVARGEPADARTDVYLLAHVLYRVLTGRRQTTGQIRAPSRVNPRFSRAVDELFLDALADDPEDRPSSCGAFASALSELLAQVSKQEEKARQAEVARAREQAAAERAAAERAAADRAAAEAAAAERAAAERASAERAAAERAAAERAADDSAAAARAAADRAAADRAAAHRAAAKKVAAERAAVERAAAERASAEAAGAQARGNPTQRAPGAPSAPERGRNSSRVPLALGLSLAAVLGLLLLAGPLRSDRASATTFEHTPRPGLSLSMVRLPGGTFDMGSPAGVGDSDEHGAGGGQVSVRVSAFSLGRTEVTNAQYAAFLNARGNNLCGPSDETCVEEGSSSLQLEKQGDTWTPKHGMDKHPIVEVSWYGAHTFAAWAKARLPTEAEWEYACRAGQEQTWAGTDDEATLTRFANVADQSAKAAGKTWSWVGEDWAPGLDGFADAAPVGRLDANDWHLQDLSGNVWEWTASVYNSTLSSSSATASPDAPSPGFRVNRGGSFASTPTRARCAVRYSFWPSFRWNVLGFRVALPAPPSGG